MTLTLEQALERIAELEALLEHAVYVKPEEWQRLRAMYRLSPSESRLAIGLYKAKTAGLTVLDIDALLPSDALPRGKPRLDPQYRTLSVSRVFILRLRRKCPTWMEPPSQKKFNNYRLTEEGRRLVGEALGAS